MKKYFPICGANSPVCSVQEDARIEDRHKSHVIGASPLGSIRRMTIFAQNQMLGIEEPENGLRGTAQTTERQDRFYLAPRKSAAFSAGFFKQSPQTSHPRIPFRGGTSVPHGAPLSVFSV